MATNNRLQNITSKVTNAINSVKDKLTTSNTSSAKTGNTALTTKSTTGTKASTAAENYSKTGILPTGTTTYLTRQANNIVDKTNSGKISQAQSNFWVSENVDKNSTLNNLEKNSILKQSGLGTGNEYTGKVQSTNINIPTSTDGIDLATKTQVWNEAVKAANAKVASGEGLTKDEANFLSKNARSYYQALNPNKGYSSIAGFSAGSLDNSILGSAYATIKGKKLSDYNGATDMFADDISDEKKKAYKKGEDVGAVVDRAIQNYMLTGLLGGAPIVGAGLSSASPLVRLATRKAIDAAIDIPQNIAIERASGLTGKELTKQVAIDTGIDATLGSILDYVDYGNAVKRLKNPTTSEILERVSKNAVKSADNVEAKPLSELLNNKNIKAVENVADTSETVTKNANLPNNEVKLDTKSSSDISTTTLDDYNKEAQMSLKDKIFNKVKEANTTFRKTIVNGQEGIEQLAKASKNDSLSDKIRIARNAGSTGAYDFENGITNLKGEVITENSFANIINKLKKNNSYDDFQKYMQYSLNPERIANSGQEKAVFRNISTEESLKIVEAIEKKHPEFKEIAKEWETMWKTFLEENEVKTGNITKDVLNELTTKFQHYIPTMREGKTYSGIKSVKGNKIDAGTGIGKATGGVSDVADLAENMVNKMNTIKKAGRRNQLAQGVIESLQSDSEAMAKYGKVITKQSDAIEISNAIKKAMNAIEDGDELDKIIAETYFSGANKVGNNYYLTARINGEAVHAIVNKDVYDAFQFLDNAYGYEPLKLAGSVGKKLSSPMKAVITDFNIPFAIANIARDIPTLYIQSNFNPIQVTKGLAKAAAGMFGNSKAGKLLGLYDIDSAKMYRQYLALGGKNTGYYGANKAIKNTSNKALKALSKLGEVSESLPRASEFINTIEKYGNTDEIAAKAFANASKVTVDFSQSAPITKTLDAWTLYLNAAVQGLDGFVQTVKKHPIKSAATALALITVPKAAEIVSNKDNPYYQQLNDRTKQNYFLIPNVLGERDEEGYCMTFIKIPMNREYGAIFGSALSAAYEYYNGSESALQNYKETLETSFMPPSPIKDNIVSPLVINIPSNQDFAGRSIIPSNLKNVSPINQYDSTTSGAARTIANIANALFPNASGNNLRSYLKSPKLVDYLLDSYTGIIGSSLQAATGGNETDIGTKATAGVVEPFTQRFTADSRYSSGVVSNFYDQLEELYKKSNDTTYNNTADANGYSAYKAAYKAYNTISNEISALYKAEKIINGITSLSQEQIEALPDSVQEELKKYDTLNISSDDADKLSKAIRTEINSLASSAPIKANEAIDEYETSPTYASLDKNIKEKYSEQSGISKEEFAIGYIAQKDTKTVTGKSLDLINSGIENYNDAITINKTISEKSFNNAKKLSSLGITSEYFDNIKSKSDYDGNGSISSKEAHKTLDNMDLTREQKIYLHKALTGNY